MNSPEILENTAALFSRLNQKILTLQREKKPLLEYAQFALMETDEAIRTLKSWILTHDFDCWENEIQFFKAYKPPFIAKYIYFTRLVSLLSAMPGTGAKYQKKIYELEFEKMHFFYLEHSEFYSYFRRQATYMDAKYFLRFKYDLDVKLAVDFHNYDERFSTSQDHIIATILANDEWEAFLTLQMLLLKESTAKEKDTTSEFRWSAPKVALTELIFALHKTNCFNGGRLDLSETIKWFEKNFNTDLGNYHKTMLEIRSRKNHKTKFIQLLSDNLNIYLDALDE